MKRIIPNKYTQEVADFQQYLLSNPSEIELAEKAIAEAKSLMILSAVRSIDVESIFRSIVKGNYDLSATIEPYSHLYGSGATICFKISNYLESREVEGLYQTLYVGVDSSKLESSYRSSLDVIGRHIRHDLQDVAPYVEKLNHIVNAVHTNLPDNVGLKVFTNERFVLWNKDMYDRIVKTAPYDRPGFYLYSPGGYAIIHNTASVTADLISEMKAVSEGK